MIDIEYFHNLIGNMIMVCQCIEHDVKIMYAGMLKGDFKSNIELVKNKPMGPVLKKLEELDYSDNNPYLSKDDYKLLNDIKEIRNYWVHKGYIEFIYDAKNYNQYLNREYEKLSKEYRKLYDLSKQIENVRIKMMIHYGRG